MWCCLCEFLFKHTQTHRQTGHRHPDTHIHKHTDIQAHRHTHTHAYTDTHIVTHWYTHTQTQILRDTHRHIHRDLQRHIYIYRHTQDSSTLVQSLKVYSVLVKEPSPVPTPTLGAHNPSSRILMRLSHRGHSSGSGGSNTLFWHPIAMSSRACSHTGIHLYT